LVKVFIINNNNSLGEN
jgi:hypothetical protein